VIHFLGGGHEDCTYRDVPLLRLVAAALLLGGCATTKPWQRESLAHPVMALDPDGDRDRLEHHLWSTREGAVGGFGGGGGGCGCN
jgi:hypothetical protein